MDTGALTSLLWFIIIGAIFYFMMRKGGCGMGHGHGGHGKHEGHPHGGAEADKTKDPVCGMEIGPAGAAGSREHMGQTFYFCSSKCMEKFDKDPKAYMGSSQGASSGLHKKHGGCH